MGLRVVCWVLMICLSQSSAASIGHSASNEEDENDIIEYMARSNFHLESHTIVTEDGYILTYHRMKYALMRDPIRRPVLLQHPLGASSAAWLLPTTGEFAYVLAESGYDVWLGNSRGSQYSRGHKSLNVTDEHYWDFSLHEMAVFDLSAGIDYILQQYVNKTDKLLFVGHAHGAVQALILSVVRPSYQDKLAELIAFAPTVYLTGLANASTDDHLLVRSLIDTAETIAHEQESKGFHFMFSKSSELFNHYSDKKTKGHEFRNLWAFNISENYWADIYRFLPSGVSTKAIHYVHQQIENGPVFRNYNYGSAGNSLHYNSTDPPVYELSRVHIPVQIFYSQNDLLVSTQNMTLHKHYTSACGEEPIEHTVIVNNI